MHSETLGKPPNLAVRRRTKSRTKNTKFATLGVEAGNLIITCRLLNTKHFQLTIEKLQNGTVQLGFCKFSISQKEPFMESSVAKICE